MSTVYFSFADFPPFAKAMREAAPEHLVKALRDAFVAIGRSDIQKFKIEQLSGGSLNVRRRGFRNSFKSKVNQTQRLDQLKLEEYTGVKAFRLFQTGGTIVPARARMLTVLTPAGRDATGMRIYPIKLLRQMIQQGLLKIIQTKSGPAIIRVDDRVTSKGRLRKGSKTTVIAWLRPRVTEVKRIDFFANFEANEAFHETHLLAALDEAMEKTLADAVAQEASDSALKAAMDAAASEQAAAGELTMPFNDPIDEKIAQNMLAAVQNVTVANGFNYSLEAQRATKEGVKRVHLNAEVALFDPKEYGNNVYFTQEWDREFQVGVIIMPADGDTTPFDQFITRITADVQKSVMVDRFRGGFAKDTKLLPPETHEQQGLEGVVLIVRFGVDYRVVLTDPYQQA